MTDLVSRAAVLRLLEEYDVDTTEPYLDFGKLMGAIKALPPAADPVARCGCGGRGWRSKPGAYEIEDCPSCTPSAAPLKCSCGGKIEYRDNAIRCVNGCGEARPGPSSAAHEEEREKFEEWYALGLGYANEFELAWEAWRAALTRPAAEEGEPTYPCRECGVARTKAEGGTTFTVCDECWDRAYKPKPATAEAGEVRRLNPRWVAQVGGGIMHYEEDGKYVLASDYDAVVAENAKLRAVVEAAKALPRYEMGNGYDYVQADLLDAALREAE